MKIVFSGKFNGDTNSLPHGEHQPNAVAFKEFSDPKKLGLVANIVAGILSLALLIFVGWYSNSFSIGFALGCLATLITMFPHELLHAICFRETAYIYTNLKNGLLFVTGPETMSKGRFIFMSLLPNLVFGFIPFLLFCIQPQWSFLGAFGGLNLAMGVGDYYNVYNALTQMPKGARTYLYQFNSYWYMPQ